MRALQPIAVRRLALAVGLLDLVLFVAAASAAVRLVMPPTSAARGATAGPGRPAPAAAPGPSAAAPEQTGRPVRERAEPESPESRSGTGAARAAALILERGLFGRPEPAGEVPAGQGPAAGAAGGPAPAVPLPVLVGTALGPAARAAAVFADGHGGQLLVGIGEPIDEHWRLVAVERGLAVVEDGDGRRHDVAVPLPK